MTEQNNSLSPEDVQIWNELWAAVHISHYNCYYEELCADFLVARWRLVDTITKFLTTATASTSAIAAWTFWVQSNVGAAAWAFIAGLAAILSLLHSSFGISDRIKEDTLIFATFQQLRIDLEHFQIKMRIRQYESLSQYKSDYLDILARFSKSYALKRPDFFLTDCRAREIQSELNKRLGYV